MKHDHAHAGHAAPGHPGRDAGPVTSHHAHMVAEFRRRFWVSLVLTVPVLVLAIAVAYGYSSAVVFGLRGEDFFWEVATLIDIMLVGHWIEMKSVLGASAALESLVRLMPAEAHLVQSDGSTRDVPVTELRRGHRVLVKPGEKIPTDGVIIAGHTSLNEAMLTGESKPVEKAKGAAVIGGSVNGEAAITVEVAKTGDETYLAQGIALVRQAQESRSRSQDLASRAAVWLTGVALGGGAVTLGAWLALGASLPFAIERTVTVMVIACPHALGLAVPLVVAVSTALSAGNGLLIRDRSAFERARALDAIVFDKTGTLTEGRFGVTDVISLGARSEQEVLRLAASLESQSEHPIAAGVVRGAGERGIAVAPPKDFRAIPGKGAEALVEGVKVKVVSPGYLKASGLSADHPRVHEVAEQGKTVVYVLVDERVEGAIALADVIRPESREALARLKALGIRVMMLTGDASAVARWVARELDLDEFFAEVLPDQKATRIRDVQARGLTVAMTGDGVNDAPALTQADVGIAVGAGTDVAIESADIVLVRSDPRDVATIVELARATYRKMVQNLWWATGYNVLAIPVAAGVLYPAGILLTPAVGAVLMSVSTVLVAFNARLLRLRR